MDLDAGHAIGDRRGLVVGEAERGGADQHETALEVIRADAAAEHIRGRDEARRDRAGCSAATRGRPARSAPRDRPPPPPRDRVAPTRAESAGAFAATRSISRPRTGTSVPPTEASIGMRRTTPRSGSTLMSPRPVAAASISSTLRSAPANRRTKGAGSPPKARTGAGPMPVGGTERALEPGHAQHHRSSPQGGGQHGVVARHARELARQLRIQPVDERGHPLRRQPVGLRHHDVDADGCGPRLRDPGDQPREPGARPGPLPVPLQALLVDGHDHDGRGLPRARREVLVGVEGGQPDEPEPRHVGQQGQAQQQGQQKHAHRTTAAAPQGAHPAALRPVRGRLGGGGVRAQAEDLRARSPARRRRPRPPRGGRSA